MRNTTSANDSITAETERRRSEDARSERETATELRRHQARVNKIAKNARTARACIQQIMTGVYVDDPGLMNAVHRLETILKTYCPAGVSSTDWINGKKKPKLYEGDECHTDPSGIVYSALWAEQDEEPIGYCVFDPDNETTEYAITNKQPLNPHADEWLFVGGLELMSRSKMDEIYDIN